MSQRPNILHIFSDQMRFDAIQGLGNPHIRTPHLDRLCEKGVAFTNGYSPSPVCISARCAMIYGQYPHHTGCYENTPMPQDDRHSFMETLTRAGYRTHGIGKCHFHPDSFSLRGFQSRERQEEIDYGSLEQEPYFRTLHEAGLDHLIEPSGPRGEMYYVPQPSQLPQKYHPTQWIGDRSVTFILEESKSENPWYLFSSFIHPHPPFAPPAPWYKMYRASQMPLPKVPQDCAALMTYVNRCQNRYKYRDQGTDLNLVRLIRAYYYACVSFVDYQVGRLLDALEETGQMENTLILFTADHGECLGDYHCFGKRTMHDPSARIPLIAYQKERFEGGQTCQVPASLVDLAPTFVDAAEAEPTSHPYDGVNLVDLREERTEREMVFSQLAMPPGAYPMFLKENDTRPELETPEEQRAAYSTYMAVSQDWKYFYSAPDNQEFLFDRRKDPEETRNGAACPFNREALLEMRSKLMAHLRSGGETGGIEGEQWRAFPRPDFPKDPDVGLLIQDCPFPWTTSELPPEYRH